MARRLAAWWLAFNPPHWMSTSYGGVVLSAGEARRQGMGRPRPPGRTMALSWADMERLSAPPIAGGMGRPRPPGRPTALSWPDMERLSAPPIAGSLADCRYSDQYLFTDAKASVVLLF